MSKVCDNINTLQEPKKVCQFVESPKKTVKTQKKNGQFVLKNQYDLKPEKHTKSRGKKIHDSKNPYVTRHFFSLPKCTNDNRRSSRP